MPNPTSHTLVAITCLIGGFTLLLVGQIQNRPLSDGYLTLVGLLMSNVVGWYFGAHSAITGAALSQQSQHSTAAVVEAAVGHAAADP